MDTTILIRTMIERGDYQVLRGSHETLRTACRFLDDSDALLLPAVLDYAERYSHYPTIPQLQQYLEGSFSTYKQFLDPMLDRLHELEHSTDDYVFKGSMQQLLDEYLHDARIAFTVAGLRTAKDIAVMGVTGDPFKKEKDLKGPDDAARWLRDYLAKDFTLPPSSPQGSWREHADQVADSLIDGLRDNVKDRCFTGLKHIDEKIAIGPKQEVRFVGILGSTHHGKSLLLRQLAYNMARSGKRVLYIPLEESPLDCWTRLSLIHAHNRPDLDIPGAHLWKHSPKSIRERHQDELRLLTDDVEHGRSVPGDIVVMQLRQWAEIVRELKVGHHGKPYDALFIDYVGHLQTGVSGPKHHEEILKIFRDAQELSQTYHGGRGLVVVTPVQANKSSVAEADNQEGEDWGTYPSLGAFQMYTGAQQDMDAVITVWQKGPLKMQAMMKVGCIKNRGGALFEPHFVAIDPRTSSIYDLPGAAKSNVAMISTYKAEVDDAALTSEEINTY
jgi:hypothetical protein